MHELCAFRITCLANACTRGKVGQGVMAATGRWGCVTLFIVIESTYIALSAISLAGTRGCIV